MRRSTLVLVVIGTAVITAFWWLIIVGGVDERIADADAETQQLRIQQSSLESQLLVLQEAAESSGAYTRALAQIAESVPAEPEMDVFIEELKAIADRQGVDLLALGVAEPRELAGDPSTDVLVIELDVAVEALFFELLGFLIELEDHPRLIVIDSLTVGRSAGGQSSPILEGNVLTVNLTASLYATNSSVVADEGGA